MKKIEVNLFPKSLKNEYQKAKEEWEERRLKYVSEYTVYEPGYSTGFFGWRDGRDVPRPDVGEVKAIEIFGREFKSFEDWSNEYKKLTSSGQQMVIDKINEIVDVLNSKD